MASTSGQLAAVAETRQPAPQREQYPGHGWALFAGVMIGLAVLKEMLRRARENPVSVRARGVSRADTALSLATLLRMVERIGAGVLRGRPGAI